MSITDGESVKARPQPPREGKALMKEGSVQCTPSLGYRRVRYRFRIERNHQIVVTNTALVLSMRGEICDGPSYQSYYGPSHLLYQ